MKPPITTIDVKISLHSICYPLVGVIICDTCIPVRWLIYITMASSIHLDFPFPWSLQTTACRLLDLQISPFTKDRKGNLLSSRDDRAKVVAI